LLTLEKDILEAKVNLQKEFESCEEKEEIIKKRILLEQK
jgi:hypothetical protein